jgi:hypothetical protein
MKREEEERRRKRKKKKKKMSKFLEQRSIGNSNFHTIGKGTGNKNCSHWKAIYRISTWQDNYCITLSDSNKLATLSPYQIIGELLACITTML